MKGKGRKKGSRNDQTFFSSSSSSHYILASVIKHSLFSALPVIRDILRLKGQSYFPLLSLSLNRLPREEEEEESDLKTDKATRCTDTYMLFSRQIIGPTGIVTKRPADCG